MRTIATFGMVMVLAAPAHAGLEVRFDEGAPKDKFTVTATGGCAVGPLSVRIDLGPSPYGLIFDTTGSGAGVEVFQPFEITAGRDRLKSIPAVRDGDTDVTLDIKGLSSGQSVAFTIDVDDTVQNREITVSNAEITGARVVAKSADLRAEASFEADATATLALPDCAS